MAENYLLVSLEDEKSKAIAEVMQSKTSKTILDLLSKKALTESEIAKELDIPLNTTGYNIKKLVSAGLIQKAKTHFWSVKGKKIPVYEIANKYIIIAPKSKISKKIATLFSMFAVAVLGALGVFLINKPELNNRIVETSQLLSSEAAGKAVNSIASVSAFDITLWFFSGCVFALIIFLIINWRKL